MLTKNFWRIFGAIMPRLNGNTYSAKVVHPSGSTTTETMFSSSIKPYTLLGAMTVPQNGALYGGTTIGTWYGRGTTPATADDYTLEDPIKTGDVTGVCGGDTALVRAEGPDHYRISVTHQITNNKDETVTISEIGCFGALASGAKVCLLDRTVPETPIVIPPQETVPVEYVIKFPYGN